MKKIIFISGVHGVGKTTLCNRIKPHTNINSHSCSTLIKENSDYIEKSKNVKNVDSNQNVLIEAINRVNDEKFLLDGHFCLLNEKSEITKLDEQVFIDIAPQAIINLTCPPQTIAERLFKRDNRTYSIQTIEEFQNTEIKQAKIISTLLNIPLYQWKSGQSTDELIDFIDKI